MQRDVLIYPAQGNALLDGNIYPADGSSPYSIPDTDREQNVVQWVWQNRKRAGATTHKTFQRQNGCILPSVPGSRFTVLSGFRWKSKRSLTHLHPAFCSPSSASALWRWITCEMPEKRKKLPFLQRTNSFAPIFCVRFLIDLRTPLTSISGNADTLLHEAMTVLDEQTRETNFYGHL
ncbi:MAG: hypothetical protein ACLSCO_17450 [Gallintestinimicrobium sp.]